MLASDLATRTRRYRKAYRALYALLDAVEQSIRTDNMPRLH